MRAAALLVLLFSGSCAFAAHTVTSAQLDQQLAILRGKPDAEFARYLGDFQLSERLTSAQLARFQAQAPGEKSRQVLLALADQAAFLAQSAAETPAAPPPDLAEQRRIMSLVVLYVSKTIPQLPNFVATRTTTRFEDTPLLQNPGETFIPYEPIHPVGAETTPVTYENGRETVRMLAKTQRADGLRTWGVFGPILGTVLLDAAQSKLAWTRWEEAPDGRRAVFTYAVPREKSHYEVNFCCVATQSALAAANVRVFQQIAPYRGEISIDPETGIIRRLLIQADFKADDPVVRADILVDYGPVEIAGRTYTCPLHSISVSRAQTVQVDPVYKFALANQMQPLKNSLNDVTFADYHIFRGDTRLVADASDASGSSLPPLSASAQAASSSQPVATNKTENVKSEGAQGLDSETREPRTPAEQPAATESAALPYPTESAASEPPAPVKALPPGNAPQAPTASPQGSGVTLHITTRLVDVPVVAYDKKGRLVTDLAPTDLQIYDNGHLQQVRFFSHEGREILPNSGPASPQAAGAPGLDSVNPDSGQLNSQSAQSVNDKPNAPAQSSTILLIDSANVAFSDLSYARSEMLRFLSGLAPGERVGLYIMKRTGVQALLEPTADHAALSTKLKSWTPSAQDQLNAQNEQAHNGQEMDYVASVTDLLYVNGNTPTGETDMARAPDPQLRSLGDRSSGGALVLLAAVGRHLASIPGHKSLVWISSDNALADFSDKAPSVERGEQYISSAALRAREALNEAHVSIYPLDASQLEAGGVSADHFNSSVQLNPAASTAQMAGLSPDQRDEAAEALAKSQRNIYPGRLTASMQKDEHTIQPAFRELAEATGGRALRRAGDIAAELNQIVADGREAYLLSFRPDQPPDNAYHHITVACARSGVTLRYRTGYFYPNPAAPPPAHP